MNTKTVDIEMFENNGIDKTIKKILFPLDYPTEIVSYEEFYDYIKKYNYNNKVIPNKAIFTQAFSKNCNGFKRYYMYKFERILINENTKEYRRPTVGEAWSFGDTIR